nr:HAMP domain-containing histidine kinase [Bacilli bacterium]
MSNHSNRPRSWVSLADKWLIRKQRFRLAIVNMIVLTIIWIGLSFFVYLLLVDYTDHSIDRRLMTMAGQVITQDLTGTIGIEIPEFHFGNNDLLISIWNLIPQPQWIQGNTMTQDLQTKLANMASSLKSNTSFQNVTIDGTNFRVLEIKLLANPTRVLQVSEDVGPIMTVVNDLLGLLLAAGLLGVILTIVGGYSLGLWTLRPLMAARKREQELVTDISHELRTPLSVMSTHLELLLRHVEEPLSDHLNWVEAIYSENRRMAHLVEDLLEMARIEAGEQFIKAAPVDLTEICQEVAAVFEPVITEKGLAFRGDIPDVGYVFGDSMRLRQLLFILLDNAQKYTNQGEIHLLASKANNFVDLTVADTGIGIPSDLLSRVTERFVRGDSARTRTKSTGLGLAIAKRIVAAHQGKLSIQSEVNKGTSITIRLKIYDPVNDKMR